MRLAAPTPFVRNAILVALAAAALGMGGCVSQDQYDRLQTAYSEARSQLAEAQHDLDRLRRQMDLVNAQLAEKERLLGEQGGGVQALLKECDLLRQQLAALQARYNKLLKLAGQPVELPASVNMALERLAEKYPDLLEFDAKRGLVRFKSDLTFALGSTEVKQRAKRALGQFARILNMPVIADNEIRIVGNTDNVPVRHTTRTVMNPTNWYLSTNRAISVLYVLKRDGVDDHRMQAAGWGKTHPIAPNKPHDRGNAMNRRVDIYILPDKVRGGQMGGGGRGNPGMGGGTEPVRHRHVNNGGMNGGGGNTNSGNGNTNNNNMVPLPSR